MYFTNERGEDHWDIAVSAAAGKKSIVAKDVRLPMRASPALSSDGGWVAWGSDVPEKAGSIYLTKLDGSRTIAVATGLVATGEPALTSAGGKTYLAFTALPSAGADWRQLHIIDISDKL